jgi:hypothetical protein
MQSTWLQNARSSFSSELEVEGAAVGAGADCAPGAAVGGGAWVGGVAVCPPEQAVNSAAVETLNVPSSAPRRFTCLRGRGCLTW